MKTTAIAFGLAVAFATAALAAPPADPFQSIDGGDVSLADFAGQPVLLVNTASQCGFTGQYEGLQALYDTYRAQGLVVLAVPSDDFNQELATAADVKEFCTINYNITLPMTDITHVKGSQAHPVYKWLRDEAQFVPRWNFNKVLIGRDGAIVATWGSNARPMSPEIVGAVEVALK
ncbi:glutathione peroxidase [Pseudorhodobacter ferrugineus]|uniref:glutathione peroxidase n=1 Tax=Pseudorhodobacter ferrugineus TaxID=77008 RepID=UPI0003B48F39|nr:glutathione peroxidase [Pseudorhodobacter ferrugineus]